MKSEIKKYSGAVTKKKELVALVEIMQPCLTKLEWDNNLKFPTIIYLHSAGERYCPSHKIGESSLSRFVTGPVIFVTPHCEGENAWEPDAIKVLIDQIVKEYPIDPKRLYLTGYSMGGRGTWDTALEYPELFAAIAPVAGYSCYLKAEKLKSVPTWAFHGVKDYVVPANESKKMVDAIRFFGNPAKLTLFKNEDHNIERRVYKDMDLYEWMLAQQKE
jgi:predicted peptidase